MSDAQDAAWRLRQRRHADQTRRRLTRIFDADGDGLSDSTLPMFGQRSAGRQGPPPSPIGLPVGETITVEATDRDDGALIWWPSSEGVVSAGRGQALPTTDLVTRTGGYYVLRLERFELAAAGGATVAVSTSSGLSRTVAEPSFGRHLPETSVSLGVLPSGTTVTVTCDQAIVQATATLEHVDLGHLSLPDAPGGGLPSGAIAWWQADEGTYTGSEVDTLTDLTGTGNTLTRQTDPGPTLLPAELDGRGVASHDGVDDRLRIAGKSWQGTLSGGSWLWSMLVRLPTLGHNGHIGDAISTAPGSWRLKSTAAGALALSASGLAEFSTSDGAVSANTWHLITWVMSDTTESGIWVDGTKVASHAGQTAHSTQTAFGVFVAGGGHAPIDLAEAIVYHGIDTDPLPASRTDVEGYFTDKWTW